MMKREHARQIHDALVVGVGAWITHAKIEFNPASPPDAYDETLIILSDERNIEIIYAAEDHVLIQENSANLTRKSRQTYLWIDADLVEEIKNVILEWGP